VRNEVPVDSLGQIASSRGGATRAQVGAGGDPLDTEISMEDDFSMTTTVTQKNMVTIPAEVGRKLGIKPGWKLDWQPIEGKEEILVRVIPDRGERARRLLGAGRKFSPERDAVSELVAERTAEG
jgi:AbrB family looped-hinge helix DNA binding protein